MNILYASGVCSAKKFERLICQRIIRQLPQAQKYHRLLVEGIRKNIDGDITVLSSYPTNRSWTKKLWFKKETERQENILYTYLSFINYPVLRQISLFLSSFKNSFLFFAKHKDAYGICDMLTSSNASGMKIACKIFNKKCIAIVTDVPGLTSGARKKTLPKHIRVIKDILEYHKSKKMHTYDGYILLSEEMNEIVNKREKPSITIEGHCDITMERKENNLYEKHTPKSILYTGGIHKEYGIKHMVEAFLKSQNDGWQLHICGEGNYEKELVKICGKNDNIKYFGVVKNEIAVEMQLRASLLINPRLTDAEYVKYSFPSKNLEYMASATPVMTTVLPSMPHNYYPYVYLIEDESEEGFMNSFNNVMNIPKEILHEKGLRAKAFVMQNKNNIVQAKKVLDYFNENMENIGF